MSSSNGYNTNKLFIYAPISCHYLWQIAIYQSQWRELLPAVLQTFSTYRMWSSTWCQCLGLNVLTEHFAVIGIWPSALTTRYFFIIGHYFLYFLNMWLTGRSVFSPITFKVWPEYPHFFHSKHSFIVLTIFAALSLTTKFTFPVNIHFSIILSSSLAIFSAL